MNNYVNTFIAHLQAQDRSPHTVDAYHHDLTAFFDRLRRQVGRDVDPVEVTPFDVQKYRDHLVTSGRRPATVNRALAALRTFFAWAVETGHAATNPAAGVKGIRQTRRVPKALTPQEVYRLRREAAARRQVAEAKAGPGRITPTVVNARRDEALLNLLLYTGLRVSEAAALRVEDVVLNARSGKVIVRSGKGRKYREVPLHREARDPLRAYLEVRPDASTDVLFLSRSQEPLGVRGIQMRLRALGKAAGGEVTPHRLRHTFATRLLREAGTDLVTVAALLGHESVTTTAIYTRPREADLARAVERLE